MTIRVKEWESNFFVDNLVAIKNKSRRLMKEFIALLSEAKFDELTDRSQASKPMRYSIEAYIESVPIESDSKEMLVQAGYNSALIDAMQLYTNEINMQREIKNIPTQYKDELLYILKKRGTLLHKDLASELEVSPSELTAIIKKMNSSSVKLINVEEISKFKLYSLTPIAYQYIAKHMPNKVTSVSRTWDKPFVVRSYEQSQSDQCYFDNHLVIFVSSGSYESSAAKMANIYGHHIFGDPGLDKKKKVFSRFSSRCQVTYKFERALKTEKYAVH